VSLSGDPAALSTIACMVVDIALSLASPFETRFRCPQGEVLVP
jgi:hypothetical protein